MDLLTMQVCAEYSARKIHAIREETFSRPRRSHGFVLYLSGACEYAYASGRFVASAGSFLLLPRDQRYSIRPVTPDATCLLIDFDADFEKPCTALVRQLNAPEEVGRCFDAAIWAVRKNAPNRRALVFSALYQIVALVDAPTGYLPSTRRSRLATAMKMLEGSFYDPHLSVGQLAQVSGVSDKYFQQLFRQAYRISPKQYLLSLRLEHAKRLLCATDAPIQEIAAACGFADAYYFSRMFKEKTQRTPSQWRKQALP